jgi:hypothetical protein
MLIGENLLITFGLAIEGFLVGVPSFEAVPFNPFLVEA